MIDKWQKILSLNDWTIVTEPIEPESVTYDPVIPVEDRYYVYASSSRREAPISGAKRPEKEILSRIV